MEESWGPWFAGIGNTVRKKRSQTFRRPRPESSQFPETRDPSPSSSTPPSDELSKVSSDDITGDVTNSRRKVFNLNQCALRNSANRGGEYPNKKIKYDGSSSLSYGNKDLGSKGTFLSPNWKTTSKTKGSWELHSTSTGINGGRNGGSLSSWHSVVNGHGVGNDKVKKVKFKVGGITRTIQRNVNTHGPSGSGATTKSSRNSDAPLPLRKMILQGNSDDDHFPPNKKSVALGVPWKDFTGGSSSTREQEDSLMGKNGAGNQSEKLEQIRKSKRVPKRRVLGVSFDEADEDDEIRYLEKLKLSKVTAGSEGFEEDSSKKQQLCIDFKNGKRNVISEDFVSTRSSKDGKKKFRSERGSGYTDYEEGEEEEVVSDGKMKKKRGNDLIVSTIESKKELGLTTRQRALLFSKDVSSVSGASVVEFPNGLPPAPRRKQKEKLSEAEQQLKKAEATERRRMQVEKAARESEAEAIRKILGQDSSRKKREDKMKQRREEIAQEKDANALKLLPNTVRLVMGPTGTVVTFSNEMGLPSIFDPKPHSYPPPRERCAGPACSNPYKYRDSKSKLPLCSLHCFKAIHEKMQAEATS